MSRTLGQIAYEAYGEKTGWITYTGQQMLTWRELGEKNPSIRAAWEAAATAVSDEVLASN